MTAETRSTLPVYLISTRHELTANIKKMQQSPFVPRHTHTQNKATGWTTEEFCFYSRWGKRALSSLKIPGRLCDPPSVSETLSQGVKLSVLTLSDGQVEPHLYSLYIIVLKLAIEAPSDVFGRCDVQ